MATRITESLEVRDFIAAAAEFCAVIDRREDLNANELLRQLYPLLARLAYRASQLPRSKRLGATKPALNRGPSGPIHESLVRKFGPKNFYWEVFDPYATGTAAAIKGSLADDLEDTYHDIQPGLTAWPDQDAEGRRHIVHDWRLNYYLHWGHHLIDAHRAIHAILKNQLAWGEDADER